MVTRRNVPEQETALGVRVDNLAGDVHGFRIELRDVRALMATREDIAGLTSSIKDIGSKQAPNFQAWAVFATVGIFLLTAFGYMAYRPVEESASEARIAIGMLSGSTLPIRQYDIDQKNIIDRIDTITKSYVGQQRAARIEADINGLRSSNVTRQEIEATQRDIQARLSRLEELAFRK